MSDPTAVRYLSKFQFELSNLSKVITRCLVWGGLDGYDDNTGGTNKESLAVKMAEVFTLVSLSAEQFQIEPKQFLRLITEATARLKPELDGETTTLHENT